MTRLAQREEPCAILEAAAAELLHRLPRAHQASPSLLRLSEMISLSTSLPLPPSVTLFFLPSSGAAVDATKQPASAPSPPRRVKRCSCYSLMDKECVYFCHLDIIWINTPERIVPYGLGSFSRTRRSLKDLTLETLQPSDSRCHCASLKDKKCMNFCQAGTEHRSQSTTEKKGKHLRKERDCKGLGLKCTFHQLAESKKTKRLDTLRNSIKASSNIAKLVSKLHKPKQLKHNRTYEKQNIWQSMKMTS